MGHTPQQREEHPLCGAKKKDGTRCRAFAGQGTDHYGTGQCKFHGGSTPNGRKHALALEAKQRMVALSVPVDDAQPHLILLKELTVSAGHVGWLRQEIGTLEPDEIGGERSKVLLHRYDEERDRLARIAKACSEAGVDEASVRVQEVQALLMVQALAEAAKDAGIPPQYVRALGPALRKQLALLSGDEASAQAAERRVTELRAQIEADEERRIERAAAERVPANLTYPPEEWVPDQPPAT
jgi:hypothetical protein